MLIDLSSDLRVALDDLRESEIQGLEMICLAAVEGSHVVIGDRAVLECLSRLERLSERARAIYRRLVERLPTYDGLRQQSVVRVVVSVIPKQAARVVSLPLSFFSESMSIQPTRLVTENLVDAKVLEVIASAWAAKNGLARLNVRADPYNGGGSTTYQSVEMLQSTRRLVLSVVDSDRKFRGAKMGDTAHRCLLALSEDCPNAAVEVLGSRELENLVPFSWLASRHQIAAAALKSYEMSRSVAGGGDFVSFMDWKCGVDGAGYSRMTGESAGLQFWSRFDSLRSGRPPPDCAAGCAEDECECVVFCGFGPAVLDLFSRFAVDVTPQKMAEAFAGGVDCDWERVGRVVWWWLCGDRRMLI